MSPQDQPVNPTPFPLHRRRRRRHFQEALAQAQAANDIPMVDVGRRLRDLRNERGLSIRTLAEKSGLNVNTLSLIENDKTSPSVATLQQLAFALEVPIASFFDTETPHNRIAYHKAAQRRRAAFTHGMLEDLGAGMISRGIETFLVVLEPFADSGSAQIVHTGREFVFCLAGQLVYTIEDQDFLLEPGDSLLFEAHLPHRWQNAGSAPSRSLLVLCPSDDSERSLERHFKIEKEMAHNQISADAVQDS